MGDTRLSGQRVAGEIGQAVEMVEAQVSVEILPELLEVTGGLNGAYLRPAPLEVEIGCGKGRFIIRCAESMPDVNFLAIERAKRYFKIALLRANRRGLANLRLIRADALQIMRQALPTASVRAIHVLFPDPWPKKRHHKRRLFQPDFLAAAADVLEDGGLLNVATDFTDYFESILGLMATRAEFRTLPHYSLGERLPEGATGHTNYEVKYRASGRTIHQSTWARRPRAACHPAETGEGALDGAA